MIESKLNPNDPKPIDFKGLSQEVKMGICDFCGRNALVKTITVKLSVPMYCCIWCNLEEKGTLK